MNEASWRPSKWGFPHHLKYKHYQTESAPRKSREIHRRLPAGELEMMESLAENISAIILIKRPNPAGSSYVGHYWMEWRPNHISDCKVSLIKERPRNTDQLDYMTVLRHRWGVDEALVNVRRYCHSREWHAVTFSIYQLHNSSTAVFTIQCLAQLALFHISGILFTDKE